MKHLPKFDGFWWSPEAPELQLAGDLVADGDLAKLTLTIDTPSHQTVFGYRELSSSREYRDYEVLHGRTSDGNLVTLIDCFDFSTSLSSSGVEKRILLANFVLVGALVPAALIGSAFTAIQLKWPGLQRWFLKSGVSVEWAEKAAGFSISFTPPDSIAFEYMTGVDIEFEFGTNRIPSEGLPPQSIEFRETVFVQLKSSSAHPLDFFLMRLNELIHFYSICTLEYTSPEEVVLLGNFGAQKLQDGVEIYPRLRLYFSSNHEPRMKELPHPLDLLVPYKAIESQFSLVLRSWGAVANEISPVRSLYFSSVYGRNQYVESTFLSLAQAAEVFHRRKYGGTYLDDEVFRESVRPFMEDAIPNSIESEIKGVYKQRLEFFNEYSFSKRLKLMSQNHEAVLDEYVPDWKKMVRGVVNARNYFTHYSNDLGSAAPNVNELSDYKDFLELLLELEILRACGVDEAVLKTQASNCYRYRRVFRRQVGK